MKRKGHSYLDLTALPEIGALLITPSPVWLWRIEDGRLLWTNPAGAALVGAATIAEALELPAERVGPPDLAGLAAKARDDVAMLADVVPGSGGDDHACAISRVALDEGAAVLAVAVEEPRTHNPLSVRAAQLTQSIAGDELAVAILKADGRPVAMSPSFAALDSADDVVAALTSRAETEHPAKRIETIAGAKRVAGAVTADTADGRLVLVIVGPPIAEEAPAPPAAPVAEDAEAEPAESPQPTEQETETPSAPRTLSEPKGFTFRIDREHRIAEVSPELAALVGPGSAAVAGETWQDVADRLGLDPDGQVSRALARGDTWSGVTIHWPIDGGDRRVALSLTALPTFDDAKRFDGFRGFGVAKAERPAAPPAAKDSAREPDQTAEPADLTVAEMVAEAEPAEPAEPPSNVVKLPTAATRGGAAPAEDGAALSGDEQDAFRRIADALRGVAARTAAGRGERRAAATTEPPDTAKTDNGTTALVPSRLLDRIPIGLLVYRDRQLLYANRTLLDRLGYGDIASFAAAGGVDGLFAGGSREAEPGGSRSVPLRAADGRQIAADARLHIVPWDDGPATMLSIRETQTVSSSRRAEEYRTALARIDELEAVLDTATDGILMLDADGHILNLNRSAEALFGVEATDMLGRPFTELLAEESRGSARDYLEGLTSNGVASVLNDGREVIGNVPSGGLIPIFMTIGRLSEHGKYCAVLRDITHWKRAEEELVSARRTAEMANQQKSEFLAKISHEIRTPLNAIIGFADVILEERFGPIGVERYREYLKDIRVSGTHLASLINDLLDLSRIESGKLDLTFNAVALNGIVQECVALMQPEANRRRIIIRTSLAADVPQVVADERSLRQIILNLLSNAVKFNSPGGQAIVSTALDESGEVVLRVRDTGIGMSDKEIETALKPFQQIATTGPARFEGTGLGLPLTKALVEANRAQFAISSAPGEGTLVRIAFPVERVLQS